MVDRGRGKGGREGKVPTWVMQLFNLTQIRDLHTQQKIKLHQERFVNPLTVKTEHRLASLCRHCTLSLLAVQSKVLADPIEPAAICGWLTILNLKTVASAASAK